MVFVPSGINCTVDTEECASDPCLYGGTCIEPTPNEYECVCPRGVEGTNCQDVFTATFSGRGPLVLSFPRDASGSVASATTRRPRRQTAGSAGLEISFFFQTTLRNGIILFAQQVRNQVQSKREGRSQILGWNLNWDQDVGSHEALTSQK